MRKIRCSLFPRFVECASCVIEAEFPYKPGIKGFSELGTAAHIALGIMVVGDKPDLEAIASKFGVDETDLRILFYWGRRAWIETLSPYFKNPELELEVESEITTGHIDVTERSTAVILDWKTGYLKSNYLYQMAGYAHGYRATFGMPSSGEITTIICWVRDGDIEVERFDDERINQFDGIVRDLHKSIGEHYGPGEPCNYCERRLECDAHARYIWQCVKSLQEADFRNVTGETIGALYPKTRTLSRLLKDYDNVLKGQLVEHGKLETGDGRELYLDDVEKDTLIPNMVYKIVRSKYGITDGEFSELVKLSKTDLLTAVKKKAERGQKQKVAAQCLDDLKEAKAINTILRQELKSRRLPND